MKKLETKRLILRKWKYSDSKDLYEYGRNPKVGPNAGWSPHKNEEESIEIINVFRSTQKDYAIVYKENNKVIGGISYFSIKDKGEDIQEIGYVLNPEYWGNGITPEAVEELKRYGFLELGLTELWCGHFDFNEKSKRVNEKCGFIYQYTHEDILDRYDNSTVQTLMYKIDRKDYILK